MKINVKCILLLLGLLLGSYYILTKNKNPTVYFDPLKIDYKSSMTDFSKKYNHNPYAPFYEGLFRDIKNDNLKISTNSSILMWKEYFTNSEISTGQNISETFDIIIDTCNSNLEKEIKKAHRFLKPGGMFIIENMITPYKTDLYDALRIFQYYYFLDIITDSTTNRLLVLIKQGDKPIVNNTNKLTLITPSYRTDNLSKIKESIKFDYIDEWIIVYDGSKITENPNLFKDFPKIKEYVYKGEGRYGNPQRNYALTKVSNENTSLYYLDDDNIVHPDLYRLINILDNTKMYTFKQFERLHENNINIGSIDTAMCIIPFKICKDITWSPPDKYEADGIYITACYSRCKNDHIFIDNYLCYYNKLA